MHVFSKQIPKMVEPVETLSGGIGLLTALAHDGRSQSAAEIIGQLVEMRVSIDLDGFLGGVTDDVTVVAPLEVILQLRLRLGIDGIVEIICEFFQKIAAGHLVPSPLFRD